MNRQGEQIVALAVYYRAGAGPTLTSIETSKQKQGESVLLNLTNEWLTIAEHIRRGVSYRKNTVKRLS